MSTVAAVPAEAQAFVGDSVDRLIERYGGRAPRYTSYPTAVQFVPSITTREYVAWLESLRRDAGAVSLYLHIPFCDRMCWYCGCNTAVVNRRGPIEDYVARLLREIDLVADTLPQRLLAGSVHFGGGTPNMLAPDEVGAILAKLAERFDFAPGAEIAAEIDPRTLTPEWVRAAAAGGMNRASLGVQDFDPKVQQAINRQQSFALTKSVVDGVRARGAVSVNLDLLYGLPHQTVESVEATVRQALSLRPDRIALFGYAHVPWFKKHQTMIDEAWLPGLQERFVQAQQASKTIREAGYAAIGIDHFALPGDSLAVAAAEGRLHRNFQGYTDDGYHTVIALGPSGISRFRQGYAQSTAATSSYEKMVWDGSMPVARGIELTGEDAARGWLIERLMCDFAFRVDDLAERFGSLAQPLLDQAIQLSKREPEMLMLEGDNFVVPEPQRPIVRIIAARFDSYLRLGNAAHSAAV